jgi:ankyrin repeat protein
MYRQLGFERIGYGWTWWLDVARLERHPPTHAQIVLAEAVGRSDLDTLAALTANASAPALDTPLANEMTLLELAAHARQPMAAEWLVQHGAALDVIVAWDLGWTTRVVQMLTEHPALANRRRGKMGTTPLHEVVERDDQMLARVLLAAQPDLAIKDTMFGGTPLDWASHLQRTTMIDLLQQYQAAQAEE